MELRTQIRVVLHLVLLLLSSYCDQSFAKDPLESYELVFTWKELDYTFPSPEIRQEYISSGRFIRENNVITGIKVTNEQIYLTIPRWRSGIPATLVSLPYDPEAPLKVETQVSDGPLLKPFPSWEMNALGNCSAFQYVQSMEIDQFGRMWIIDVGRVAIFETPDTTCPPKLVLLDLKTNTVVLSYEFPNQVVNHTNNFLNDIVVGCTTAQDCWAYISDASDARVVVFNLAEVRSWFVSHPTMLTDPDAKNITLDGNTYVFDTPVNGIALSQRDKSYDRLFYSPLSSFEIFSVPTSVLKGIGGNGSTGGELKDTDVRNHGVKSSQTDGMIIDASGGLTYALLGENSVHYWNTTYGNLTEGNQILLIQSEIDLQWADTFAIDEYGYVFATTNKLHRFVTDTYDFETTNFRVIRFYLGVKSYMFSASEPILPLAKVQSLPTS